MNMFKLLLFVCLSFIFGFGIWYLIFWFFTNEPNLFVWHWVTKTLFLMFSFSSTTGIMNSIEKEL